jgi:hypothetical protein
MWQTGTRGGVIQATEVAQTVIRLVSLPSTRDINLVHEIGIVVVEFFWIDPREGGL